MSEWKEYKLGDIATFSQGIQIDIENQFSESFEDCVRFIRIVDFTKGTENEIRYIKNPGEKYIVKSDDLVMIRYGSQTAGKIARGFSGAIANNTFKISMDEKKSDKNFIYYFLSQQSIFNFFHNSQSSSTMPAITFGMIGDLDIELPPLPEQKTIASILSSLDDKIDLLHRQNTTLEKMAETLFRQWFVEEEWNGTLTEYIKVQGGFAFKSKDFKEIGYAGVIKIRNITMGMIDISNSDYVDQEVVKNIDKRFKIKSGDFLIAMTGAEIGKIGIVEKTEKEIWVNQRVGKLEAKVPFGDLIGYLALKSREGQDHIINACAGSAQENISSTGIEEMSFIPYGAERTNSLGKEIEPLFKKIIFNQSQIRTLTALRDTLLPKLMSGEVRVQS